MHDELLLFFGGRGGVILGFGVLSFGAIAGGDMGVRLVLPFSSQAVLETLECSGDITWHGEMDFPLGIIPVKRDTTV